MTQNSQGAAPPHARLRQDGAPAGLGMTLLVLLAIAVVFNAGDRGSLSIAGPFLMRDLGLSNTQLGLLLSAFFWTYAPAQLIAGSLAERAPLRWVIGGGFALWAVATFCTGFAQSFTAILLLRLVLGVGESTLFPAASKLLAEHTAETARGKANAIFLVGLSLGPALGSLAGGAIQHAHGWRAVFFAFGAASLLWLLPWSRVRLPRPRAAHLPGAPGYRAILRQRAAWGMAIGHFCANYMGYFLLTWLPSFLVNDRKLGVAAMAIAGAAVFATEALSSILAGTLADRAVARGVPVDHVRRRLLIFGTLGIAAFMLAAGFAPTDLAIACLMLAAACRGAQIPSMYAVAQSFAGPRAGGRWMGFENAFANLAGILAPSLTGYAVDRTGNYIMGFVLVAVFSMIGVACWRWVIGPVAPIDWDAPA